MDNQALNLQDIYVQYHGNIEGEQRIYGDRTMINMPVQCAYCNKVGSHNHITSVANEEPTHYPDDMITIMSCPFCKRHTIHLMYSIDDPMRAISYHTTTRTFPSRTSDIEFTDNIKNNFSNFVEIYTQSKTAEDTGLNQIAGIGYRKAFEFLITDYLIDKIPENKDLLENPKTTLGRKIDLIPDPELVTFAKASSYLGNDETHYTRRHPEMGIEDLKIFIELVITEIERDLAREKANQLVNKSKSQANQLSSS